MKNHTKRNYITADLPYTSFMTHEIPEKFTWQNVEGVNCLTRSLNQHLPTYCGSCWAHAAVTVLADRIKIRRMMYMRDEDEEMNEDGMFPDVALSIQFILNCGGKIAGSCRGGKMEIRQFLV